MMKRYIPFPKACNIDIDFRKYPFPSLNPDATKYKTLFFITLSIRLFKKKLRAIGSSKGATLCPIYN